MVSEKTPAVTALLAPERTVFWIPQEPDVPTARAADHSGLRIFRG